MSTLDQLVNQIKKEVDDELIAKFNETNNEVDSIIKIEGKRKHIVPDTNTIYSPIIKRNKRNYHESPGEKATELKTYCPDLFIFTTRLDEMCLFKRDFKKLNRSHVWEDILRESKPVYSQHKHITTQTMLRYENSQKLYDDIRIINDKSPNVFDDKCQAKEKSDEMEDISTNKNLRQINMIPDKGKKKSLKLKVYKRNSLIDDTRSSDKSMKILDNANNQIISLDISEGALSFRSDNVSNNELVTVRPESVVNERKSLMESRYSDIQVMALRSRTSPEQFSVLIDFMERHGDLSRHQPGLQGNIKSYQLWKKLTYILNSLGGVPKSLDEWKKVWADWKANSKKGRLRLRQQSSSIPSTALEEPVESVIGKSEVIGQAGIREQGFNGTSSETIHEAGSAIELPFPLESDNILLIVSEDHSENIESLPTTTSTTPPRISPRARRNSGLTPLERASDQFAVIDRRRRQHEQARDKRLRESEMEMLRLEAERKEVARERKSLLHQLSLLGQQLIDVISKKHQQVGSLPSTDRI